MGRWQTRFAGGRQRHGVLRRKERGQERGGDERGRCFGSSRETKRGNIKEGEVDQR